MCIRDRFKFLNRYGIFWVPPGESSCPGGSEYVWQRGVGSLQGRVTAARSWPLFREKKITLGGVGKNLQAAILTLEQNPPKRKFSTYIKIFPQEDLALKSKLRPGGFLLHRPIFAGNLRFTGISQLRAGKTRSKRPRSHCLSTRHLLPYMWALFYPFDRISLFVFELEAKD